MLHNIPEKRRSQIAHSSMTFIEGFKIQFYVDAYMLTACLGILAISPMIMLECGVYFSLSD
jgi:hypothetical protein